MPGSLERWCGIKNRHFGILRKLLVFRNRLVCENCTKSFFFTRDAASFRDCTMFNFCFRIKNKFLLAKFWKLHLFDRILSKSTFQFNGRMQWLLFCFQTSLKTNFFKLISYSWEAKVTVLYTNRKRSFLNISQH